MGGGLNKVEVYDDGARESRLLWSRVLEARKSPFSHIIGQFSSPPSVLLRTIPAISLDPSRLITYKMLHVLKIRMLLVQLNHDAVCELHTAMEKTVER
jgi:hypothetical protein